MLTVELGDLALLIHLMSAGRLQLFDSRASLRDKASRLLLRLDDGRELRLREFGTQQRAWAKLLPLDEIGADEQVATLGPEALPPPGEPRRADRPAASPAPAAARPAGDQRDRPLLGGRDPVDGEALAVPQGLGPGAGGGRRAWRTPSSPRCRARSITTRWCSGPTVPDKMPMPLEVHRRAGEECPRCGTTIEAIHFKDYVMCYCPEEQTGGRVLKDRRLSRLLK